MAKEKRKKRTGLVVRKSTAKTAVVAVKHWSRHPIYKKATRGVNRYLVHDSTDRCKVGDLVKVEETRPISRLKRWRVVEIVGHREIAQVKPEQLDVQVAASDEPANAASTAPEAKEEKA